MGELRAEASKSAEERAREAEESCTVARSHSVTRLPCEVGADARYAARRREEAAPALAEEPVLIVIDDEDEAAG
eukprot:731531-Rhodomonas_salina.1